MRFTLNQNHARKDLLRYKIIGKQKLQHACQLQLDEKRWLVATTPAARRISHAYDSTEVFGGPWWYHKMTKKILPIISGAREADTRPFRIAM